MTQAGRLGNPILLAVGVQDHALKEAQVVPYALTTYSHNAGIVGRLRCAEQRDFAESFYF